MVACRRCPCAAVCLVVGYEEMLERRVTLVNKGRWLGPGWNEWQEAKEGIPSGCPAQRERSERRLREQRARIREALKPE